MLNNNMAARRFKGKISVIGAGFVGSSVAYTLMLSGLVSEISLVDINIDKAQGDVMDMNHGVSFVAPVKIYAGDYSVTKNSDLVIITAGVNQKPGESRIDLLKRNAAVFKNILSELTKYISDETMLLVVTNPVDILTYAAIKLSDISPKKIIGSGTVLDTARLKYLIGEHTNVDTRNIHTYIIGEHGDTETAAWGMTTIAGIKIDDYCDVCKMCDTGMRICKSDYLEMTKNAAYDIISKKGATYYAVALAVRRIVECIIGNEHSILTVSSYLDGEYGIKDICLGVPTLVNGGGIGRIIEIPLTDEERAALHRSAAKLSELAREIDLR